jgi:hypothetical protein
VAYFSGEEGDPDRRACQVAMEDLSYHAQGLLCAAMEEVLQALPPAELADLMSFAQAAARGVRKWRRRLRASYRDAGG